MNPKVLLLLLFCSTYGLADLILGVCPTESKLLSSKEKLSLFTRYLESKLGEPVKTATTEKSEDLIYFLESGKIDFALLSNTSYRAHHRKLSLLANFSRTKDTTTHRLLLLTTKNSGIQKPSDLHSWKTSLALDMNTPSRIYWLTSILNSPPVNIFSHIVTVNRVPEALNGVINGTYGAACVESGVLEAIKRFDPGLINQLKTVAISPAFASDPLVFSKQKSSEIPDKIRAILIQMDQEANGQQVLLALKITRFIPAKTDLALYPAKPMVTKRPEPKPETKPVSTVSPSEVKATEPTQEGSATPAETRAEAADQVEPSLKPLEEKGTPETAIAAEDSNPKTQGLESDKVAVEEPDLTPKQTAPTVPDLKMDLVQATQDHTSSSWKPMLWIGVPVFLLALIIFYFVRGKKTNASVKDPAKSKPGDTTPKEPSTEDSPESQSGHFSGDLKTFCFPELLQLLASTRETGELTVQGDSGKTIMRFQEGQLCTARFDPVDSRYQLGSLLIRLHKITRNNCKNALNLMLTKPELKLGQCLLEQGMITKENLMAGLKYQAQEIIFTMFLMDSGQFELVRKDIGFQPGEDPLIKIVGLILEGTHRHQSWEKLLECLPGEDFSKITLQTAPDLKLDKVNLTPAEINFIKLFDGAKTVDKVIKNSGCLNFEAGQLLCRLLQMKYLV